MEDIEENRRCSGCLRYSDIRNFEKRKDGDGLNKVCEKCLSRLRASKEKTIKRCGKCSKKETVTRLLRPSLINNTWVSICIKCDMEGTKTYDYIKRLEQRVLEYV